MPSTPTKDRPHLSPAEMSELLIPAENFSLGQVDRFYKWRNLFLFAVVLVFLVKLLLFPESVLTDFAFSPSKKEKLEIYLQYRGAYLLFGAMVYAVSYINDWHFEKVALTFCVLPIVSLVLDSVNVYAELRSSHSWSIWLWIASRLIAIYCLFMNYLNMARIPPMPRRFRS